MSYIEGTGIGPYEGARVTVEPSGMVRVATGVGTQGQGHFTTFAQLVAEQLGVDVAQVQVVTGDTREFNWGTGTFASRGAVVAGSACHAAAVKVRDKILALAARAARARTEARSSWSDGRASRAGGAGAGHRRWASWPAKANPLRGAVTPGTEPGLEATAYFGPDRGNAASGVHAMVVEVDPETAEVEITRYVVVHDCGMVINPMVVEAQVQGGVAHGIGNAFYEQLVFDENGQLHECLVHGLSAAHRARRADGGDGPHRNAVAAQSAGHQGRRARRARFPPAPLFAQAVEDALAGTGVEITEIPLSPNRLFELIAQARGGAA